jgi:hypothetical protein
LVLLTGSGDEQTGNLFRRIQQFLRAPVEARPQEFGVLWPFRQHDSDQFAGVTSDVLGEINRLWRMHLRRP